MKSFGFCKLNVLYQNKEQMLKKLNIAQKAQT